MLKTHQVTTMFELSAISQKSEIVEFLHTHLDKFRDDKEAIGYALDYALSTEPGKGGSMIIGTENKQIVGVLIMNKTGMQKYIPENILVYVAVHADFRGKGIGKTLVNEAIRLSSGNIALHVEYDNPAKRLYERLGFTTKYAEMRYKKSD